MKISDLLKYYNQDDIADEVMRVCQNREAVPRFNSGVFSTRPSVMLFKSDFLNFVRQGAVSFHISEEQWRNPLSLNQANTKNEMDELRIGWDLILDIDTKVFDYAKITADLLCKALEFHNITNYSVKFSGGTGFHIGVPFQSFPDNVDNVKTSVLFPSAPQKIAMYLREMIKDKLADYLLQFDSLEKMAEKAGKQTSEMLENGELNPYSLLEIDTIALSPRHLFRMPYSVNEKKWLVSLPLTKKELTGFSPEDASVEKAAFTHKFLDGSLSRKNEARELFVQAFDWYNRMAAKAEVEKAGTVKSFTPSTEKIPPEFFPPCIKKILAGMEDGRKRGLFIIINFLKSANYGVEEIESMLGEWNKRNKEPLKDAYIKSQLSWIKKRGGSYLPPNCNSLMYYEGISVCSKDDICEQIKNPLSYSFYKKRRRKK